MATIRKLPNGKFRADIRKNYTFIQAKTFVSKKEAELMAAEIDVKIDELLALPKSKTSALTPEEVETLGGRELFLKLGIELEFEATLKLIDGKVEMQFAKR